MDNARYNTHDRIQCKVLKVDTFREFKNSQSNDKPAFENYIDTT